jgi:hypothetical protein
MAVFASSVSVQNVNSKNDGNMILYDINVLWTHIQKVTLMEKRIEMQPESSSEYLWLSLLFF